MMNTRIGKALAAAVAAGVLIGGAALAQLQAVPVEVLKGKGEFAKKLHGATMPNGRGWKAVTDQEKRVQVMVPERWKVDAFPDGDRVIYAVPPGSEKEPKAVLMVIFTGPSDKDPLDVQEPFAVTYAEDLAEEPALKKLGFKVTDSGFVLARGMKFALAGGTMVMGPKKEVYQQQQLLFISEDRIVAVQFTATEKEFAKHLDDVVRIFASYQNIGAQKPLDPDP